MEGVGGAGAGAGAGREPWDEQGIGLLINFNLERSNTYVETQLSVY